MITTRAACRVCGSQRTGRRIVGQPDARPDQLSDQKWCTDELAEDGDDLVGSYDAPLRIETGTKPKHRSVRRGAAPIVALDSHDLEGRAKVVLNGSGASDSFAWQVLRREDRFRGVPEIARRRAGDPESVVHGAARALEVRCTQPHVVHGAKAVTEGRDVLEGSSHKIDREAAAEEQLERLIERERASRQGRTVGHSRPRRIADRRHGQARPPDCRRPCVGLFALREIGRGVVTREPDPPSLPRRLRALWSAEHVW